MLAIYHWKQTSGSAIPVTLAFGMSSEQSQRSRCHALNPSGMADRHRFNIDQFLLQFGGQTWQAGKIKSIRQ